MQRLHAATLAVLLSFPALAHSQAAEAPLESFDIPFSGKCGLVTRYASNKIPAECLLEAWNITLDEDLTWSRRFGQSKYNPTPCTDTRSIRGLWRFDATSGTSYMVIFSSQTMFQTSGDGSCTAIAGLSSLSAAGNMECVQALGRLWCTNGTNPVFSWDGTSTQTISGAPQGELIGSFRNRIIIAKSTGSLTRIRGSGDGDGTDWTLQIPGRSTTPFSIDIAGLNDGNAVTCLMGEYQNAFVIGRDGDLSALYGNDRRDFVLRRLSNEIGCTEPKSVREKNNSLYWISRRGVEKMTGTTITRASDNIRPTIDEIISAAGNSVSFTDTTQSDFQAGNSSASGLGATVSLDYSPGDVSVSSWAYVDTSSADFVTGPLTYVSTNTVGSITMTQRTSGTFTNAGAESNSNTINWQTNNYSTGTSYCTFSAAYGSTQWGMPDVKGSALTVQVLDTSNSVLISTTITLTDNAAYAEYTLNIATFTNQMIVIRANQDGFDDTSAKSVPFIRPPSIKFSVSDGQAGGGIRPCWDVDESSTTTSAEAESRIFDTSIATPVPGPFIVDMSSDSNGRATFATQMSTAAGGTFLDYVAQTPDAVFSSSGRRFIRYRANFAVNSTTNTPATISSISLAAKTTAYFIGQCRNPGSAINSWGVFSCNNAGNDGTFTFYVATGATCHTATRATATWNTQINESPITVGISSYVAYRVLFELDSSTENPTLNDCTIRWNEGSSRPQVVSEVFRDRYYMNYTTNTAQGATNDHAAVLDQNDVWTIYDGVNASAAVVYTNKLYTGDSTNTGNIRRQEVGHDDSGSAYTMRFRTADLDMGDATRLKTFRTLYAFLRSESEPSQSINITFRYRVDGSTKTYSLGNCNLDEAAEPGYFTCKLPFPVTDVVDAHWISIEAESTGTQGPVKLYGMRLMFTRKDPD